MLSRFIFVQVNVEFIVFGQQIIGKVWIFGEMEIESEARRIGVNFAGDVGQIFEDWLIMFLNKYLFSMERQRKECERSFQFWPLLLIPSKMASPVAELAEKRPPTHKSMLPSVLMCVCIFVATVWWSNGVQWRRLKGLDQNGQIAWEFRTLGMWPTTFKYAKERKCER